MRSTVRGWLASHVFVVLMLKPSQKKMRKKICSVRVAFLCHCFCLFLSLCALWSFCVFVYTLILFHKFIYFFYLIYNTELYVHVN